MGKRFHSLVQRFILLAGEARQFKVIRKAARLTGADVHSDVLWTVNDIPGGNETVGKISPTGLYAAVIYGYLILFLSMGMCFYWLVSPFLKHYRQIGGV